jgi:hypothetical protein
MLKKTTITKILVSILLCISFFVGYYIYAEIVTDGDVILNIPDYDATIGWLAGDVYDTTVTVDFADTTSLNKKVEITLPEGMRFVAYPVTYTPASGSPGYEIDPSSVLGQFIDSITEPPQQTYYPSYNGTLTYNITTNCQSIEIPVKITVDERVYYGPKTITDAVVASGEKGGVVLGNPSMDVDGIGDMTFFIWSADWSTVDALAGTTDLVELPRAVFLRGGYEPKYFYAKEMTLYYYYPTEVKGITTLAPSAIVEINDTEGYIKSQWINRYNQTTPVTAFASTENTSVGLYTATHKPQMQVIAYDDTVINIEKDVFVKVNVVNSVDNKLGITMYNNEFYDEADDYYIMGPRMRIFNDQVTDKTNQHVEYTIDPNYEVRKVTFPKDETLGSIGDIVYKTNLNSTLQTATTSQIIEHSDLAYITKDSLGLSANEYLIYADAAIGGVSKRYETVREINSVNNKANIIGKLKDGVNSANITVRTYATLVDGSIEPNSEASITKAINRVSAPTSTMAVYASGVSMNAGETKTITLNAVPRAHYRSNTIALMNPKMYIRIPKNTEIDISSIKITGNIDGPLPFTVTGPYTSAISGERFLEIAITGKTGYFFEDAVYEIKVEFDINAGLSAQGNYNLPEYIFWKDDVSINYGIAYTFPAIVSDTLDVDNDGDTTEKLIPVQDKDLQIIAKQELIIDTFIVPEGETRKPPYDGTLATATGFTPGTTAKYTVDMLNNRTDIVNEVRSYIPVPREGNNFGTNFQDNPFYWNMKLSTTPTVKIYDKDGNDITATAGSNYVITYSNDATNESNYETATYTSAIVGDTTMIRVINTSTMQAGERAILEFDYIVDETESSIIADPTKLGSINDFMPYYYFDAGSAGWQSGTRVGAVLEIGKIGGFAFIDVDMDGVYTSSTDQVLSNKTVELYKKDTSGTYIPEDTIVTDAYGMYEFNGLSNGVYRVDFNSTKTSTQEFTFKDQGSDESKDSDVDYVGTNKGFVDDIDPTTTTAKQISVGVINYDHTTDLSVALNKTVTSLKQTNSQTIFTEQLTQSILPIFFNTIQAQSQSIVWSSNDPSVVTISGGLLQGVSQGTANTTITITDMYGYTASEQCAVTVTSNDIPTIQANNQVLQVGTTFNPLSVATASDTEDGDISANIVVTANNTDNTKVGVYDVSYKVIDSDGNYATKDITVTYTAIQATVETQQPSNISTTQSTLNANITNAGGEKTSREFEWGISSGTYADTCITNSGLEGSYSCNIENLTSNTTYYYRAKTTNSFGTSYGNEMQFTTESTITPHSTIKNQGTIKMQGNVWIGGN